MIYCYYINLDERGEFYSDVRDDKEKTVAEFHDAVEFNDDGFGDLRDLDDVVNYLVSVGILGPDDELEWG